MPHHLIDVADPGDAVLRRRLRAAGARRARRDPLPRAAPDRGRRHGPLPAGPRCRACSRAPRATKPCAGGSRRWPTASATRGCTACSRRVDPEAAARIAPARPGARGAGARGLPGDGPSDHRAARRTRRRAAPGLPRSWSSASTPDRDGAAERRSRPAPGAMLEQRPGRRRCAASWPAGVGPGARPLQAIGYRQAAGGRARGADASRRRSGPSSPTPCASRSAR